jgi:hypothetical protein
MDAVSILIPTLVRTGISGSFSNQSLLSRAHMSFSPNITVIANKAIRTDS